MTRISKDIKQLENLRTLTEGSMLSHGTKGSVINALDDIICELKWQERKEKNDKEQLGLFKEDNNV